MNKIFCFKKQYIILFNYLVRNKPIFNFIHVHQRWLSINADNGYSRYDILAIIGKTVQ